MDELEVIPCTLDPTDLTRQVDRWRSMMAQAGARRHLVGALFVYFEATCHDQLAALVEMERGCCAWAGWSLTQADHEVLLRVTGPPALVAALAAAIGI